MKYAVVSHSSPNVILALHHTQLVANWVCNSSVFDARVRQLTLKNCENYMLVTQEWLLKNNAVLEKDTNAITLLEDVSQEIKDIKFMSEKRLSLFDYLNFWSMWIKGRSNRYAVYEFPELARYAIQESQPEALNWHHWILDHASIHNITPLEAYRELKLISDAELDFRFRVGSLTDKWVSKISSLELADLANRTFVDSVFREIKSEFILVRKI